MATITLAVMAEHNLLKPKGYQFGDVFAVYPRIKTGCRNPKAVFIHVTNSPVSAALASRKLIGHVLADENDPDSEMFFRARWRIKPSALPAAVRQELINNREDTVDWPVLKQYFKNHTLKRSIMEEDLYDNN